MASFIEQLRKDGLEEQKREVKIQVENVDVEKREAEFSFSSEYEVHRFWGVETLGHNADEIDLTRLNNGGAFLNMHNPWDQRGVVLKAWLGDDKRCHCRVRLSRSAAGEELLNDMADGIRTQVSVGYRIHDAVLIKQEDGVEYYRVIKWEPTEVSSVSIAADPSVGVGRSQTQSQEAAPSIRYPINIQRGESAMDQQQDDLNPEAPASQTRSATAPAPAPAPTAPVVDTQGLRGEQSDAEKIAKTAQQYGAVEFGMRAISEGQSYEQFRDGLMQELHKRKTDKKSQSTALNLDLPDSDLRAYSLMNVIRGLASGNLKKYCPHELEISNALAERMDKDAQGIHIPYDALGFGMRQQFEQRQQAAGTVGKGAELVATDLHSDLFIDALRAETVMGKAGARVITGLVGNVDIPKKTGTATFYWVGEDGAPSDSDLSFSVVQMTPRTVCAAVPMTRRMALQSSMGIENMVRSDLLQGLAEALDQESLDTILAAAGIGAVDMTGGINWAKVVELETDVEEANAMAERMFYMVRPSMKGIMKTTEKAAGTAQYLWEKNMVNGYPGISTTRMPAGDILFGDFSQLMMGLWGSVDLTVDKATKAATGGLVLRIFQDADTAIRQEGAFSYGNA